MGFLVFNIGMGLLIYVFACHLENTTIAYIAYFLSAYALVIFSIWFYKVCKFSNNNFKNKSRLYKFYNNHHKKILKSSLIFSFLINLIYGFLKLTLGIYYKSEWLITLAVYYLLLCLMRGSFFLKIEKVDGYKKLKHIGIILLFLDIVLAGMIILIIKQNQIISYPGYLIYIVALYDFYLIISAFIKVFKYHKKNSPILIASKCINLTVAMISMISLEVAMINKFGSNDNSFKLIMISCTGLGVCFINSFMAIYLIIKNKYYRKIKSK